MILGILVIGFGLYLLYSARRTGRSSTIGIITILIGLIISFSLYSKMRKEREIFNQNGSHSEDTGQGTIKPAYLPISQRPRPNTDMRPAANTAPLDQRDVYHFPLTIQPPLSAPFVFTTADQYIRVMELLRSKSNYHMTMNAVLPVLNISNFQHWRAWAMTSKAVNTYLWLKNHVTAFDAFPALP